MQKRILQRVERKRRENVLTRGLCVSWVMCNFTSLGLLLCYVDEARVGKVNTLVTSHKDRTLATSSILAYANSFCVSIMGCLPDYRMPISECM